MEYGGSGGTITLKVPYLHKLMSLLFLCLGLMLLSPVFRSPTKQRFLGFSPQPFWSPSEKRDQIPLPLSQLVSYLKVLEDFIQQ